jgi:1,4-alpha-glucan branching enzyme
MTTNSLVSHLRIAAFLGVLFACSNLGQAQTPIVLDPPAGTVDGVNVINGSTVIVQLRAPGKDYVHLRGDFNNFTSNTASLMRKSVDGNRHWLQLSGLSPGMWYRYHFLVEGNLEIGDPYAQLVLDPWNDQYIPQSHYPGMPSFPTGQASWHTTAFRTDNPYFLWTDNDFQRPPSDRLVIYETLVRDFDEAQTFQDLINQLDYLEFMGYNAIELMPVSEFEGNLSWGYNPNFRFAVDKFYGTAAKLKELVNKCHARGIAVIVDVVPNHSFGTDPLVRLYQDPDGSAADNNPWFNKIAKHPFSPGYDFDHGDPWTREFWKRVFDFWIDEFHIDGYRIDLSKGLTQTDSGSDVGAWNQYDQSRVDILFDYANDIWSNHPGTYLILEHLGNNDEETALANGGFMIWGKMTTEYTQAVMGYDGDINYGSWQARGYQWPNLVTYAESHDEERMAYELTTYGNAFNGYDAKEESTAMDRLAMAHAFLLAIPGPKMIWQWGELGYQISIFDCLNGTFAEGCKLDEKPAPWGDLANADRLSLAKTIAALNDLKKNQPAFGTYDYNVDGSGKGKRIHLYGPDQNVVLVGNFDVAPINMVPGFPYVGTWHDHFTGQSMSVNNLGDAMALQPGEWHLFMDTPLPTPDTDGTLPILVNVGCTDVNAQNYDPLAEADNGTCQYETVLQLDMGDLPVDSAGVHVAGSFQSWQAGDTPLELGADSIYRTTVVAQVGTEIQYKFLNGNVWGTDEGVPGECGVPNGLGGFNRAFVVAEGGATLDVHCYASCTTCLPPVPEDCAAGDCCGEGTVWDAVSGTCVADGTSASPCVEDIDNDGAVGVSDILLLLGSFGEICE